MKTSTNIENISKALLEAQKKIGSAKKDANNPFFHSTYADLGSVMEACKEALNENGITVLQPVGTDENGVYVETVLLHTTGEWIADKLLLSIKEQNNPQAQGSAISYARRYGLQSMCFIPAEDDDAEKATSHKEEKEVDPEWIAGEFCPKHPSRKMEKLEDGTVGHVWKKDTGEVLVCNGSGFPLKS